MADSAAAAKHKRTKKRKAELKVSAYKERPAKAPRKEWSKEDREEAEDAGEEKETGTDAEERETSGKIEEGRQWRNLELILSIQNKLLDDQRKVELVLHYVNSRSIEESVNEEGVPETLSISRVITYISNWIQSLLISSEKKIRVVEDSNSEVFGFYLDCRCWEIFRFCLKESLRFHVSLSLSRDLLRVIRCVCRNVLHILKEVPVNQEKSDFDNKSFLFYSVICDCISLIFSSHGGILNGNLDLWMDAVDSVLLLVIKIYANSPGISDFGILVIQLSCWVLEPFCKFLRVHPCRKSGFRDFVDKLLEPLLHLLRLLHDQIDSRHPVWTEKLSKLVEEVTSYGLFHPVHIDEFPSLHSSEKYSSSTDGKMKDPKNTIKSYHRHLFDGLENIISQKKVLVLGGIGELFQLFVDCVKKQRRVSTNTDSSIIVGNKIINDREKDLFRSSGSASEMTDYAASIDSLTRKLIFDFFVKTTELLLLDMEAQLQSELPVGASFLDVLCALKSTNKMLSTLVDEKLYLRTDDTIGGACINFLKVIYAMVMSYSAKANELWLSTCGLGGVVAGMDALILVAKEIVVSVSYFLEIEYEVIGDDLVSMWHMIISFLAMKHYFDIPELLLLTSGTVDLACQLVNLYSELRQVNRPVFALCSGLRNLLFIHSSGESKYSGFLSSTSSLAYEKFAKSARWLLCLRKFRLTICDAIKTIPEGQASGFVQLLAMDISESLEWIKAGCSAEAEAEAKPEKVVCRRFSMQAELLGIVLAEIYAQVLDSLFVTAGNSYLMGVSIKNLIMGLCPHMSSLLALEWDGCDEFVFSVTGRTVEGNKSKCKIDLNGTVHWIILFFFRLYVSCRSLYHQAVSLMHPDSSKKMSMSGDFSAGYSGWDWIARADLTDEGYFSWILQPSASLHNVIQSVLHNVVQEGSADYSSLIYVMHVMCFQRLVDLNRKIQSTEYLIQKNDNLIKSKLMDDCGSFLMHNNRNKWQRFLSVLRQEAASLTDFIMGYLSLVDEKQLSISIVIDEISNESSIQMYKIIDSWDLGVCAVNEKTLPTAVWWIICRNIDIWCIHAARSKLKFFLSLLISTTLPNRDLGEIGKYTCNYSADVVNVTVHQVSLELLHDPVFYEQRFVHRYMASRFCRILEKSIMPLSRDSANVDAKLDLLPDWKEILSALEKSSMAVGSEQLTCECSSRAEPVSFLYTGLAKKCSKEQTSFSLSSLRISASQSLLNLLCYLPKRSLSFKSFSRYATSLLKFERILVCSFVKSCWTLCLQKQNEVLRLLVSCRRALKYLIMEFCEDKMEASEYSILPVFAESLFPILWLLKSVSVVVGRQNILSNDDAGQVNDFIFSLMDHTSYIFLTLCKYQINYDRDCDLSGPTEFCCSMNSDISACFSVMTVAEVLIDQTRNLLHSLNDVSSVGKAEVDGGTVDLNKFSSLMSCIQGFLWGLTSSLNSADIKICNLTTKPVRFKHKAISKINHCMDLFSEFIDALLQMFLIDNSQHPGCRCDSQEQLKPDHYDSSHVMESSLKEGSIDENDPDYEKQHLNSEIGNMHFLSSDIVDDSDACTYMKKLQSDVVCLATSVLTEDDSFTHNLYSKNLLRSILSGENLKAAFLLRELFIAASAMLRLSVQINYSPLSSSSLQILFGSSQFLLAELANVGEVPKPVAFIWLDGALRFLEELGSQFPLTSPITTRNVYARLVNLHLRAIGKCIILQGKRATLATHGTELSTKTLNTRIEVLESSSSDGLYGLEELMTRLRQSFKVLIQKSSELHLLSALQAIKRAIVGQVEGCTMIYEVNTGTSDGIASSTVAAGVDCLDLILEAATGNKRLGVVRRHIQTLIASLFNIILHLQGPAIFYEKLSVKGVNIDPDPGSVILMCVEVLTRISGKHVLFQMDSGHVGQSLRIPAALFQGFSNLKLWKDSHPSSCSRFTGNKNYDNLASSLSVDRNFSVNLYAACCRLLCTVLKNYKSLESTCLELLLMLASMPLSIQSLFLDECVQLIALLQNSVQALLYCLEMIDGDSAGRKGYFTWEVQEGIKCACYLRRIYEEIRQRRDIYGQHCFLFLSNYIWLYSGYGPSRKGIKREIDDALRPGIYALIDVCTSDDLQYLHTVFGEGPCRSTLSSLQQAYKLNFQYGGKV